MHVASCLRGQPGRVRVDPGSSAKVVSGTCSAIGSPTYSNPISAPPTRALFSRSGRKANLI